MSKSSSGIFLMAVIAGIVVIGGFLILRDRPEPVDTVPPVADAGIDISVEVGEVFSLDGSDSHDDTGIQLYRWKLGAESAAGEEVDFTLTEAGVYFATLTVTDADGNTDQATVQITVTQPDEIPEPTPEPEPASLPEIDGLVGVEEYPHTTTESNTGVKVSWANTEDTVLWNLPT